MLKRIMNKDQYHKLMIRCLTNEASKEEKELFEEWLNRSEKNQQLFADYKKLWQTISSTSPEANFDIQQEWQQLSKILNIKTSSDTHNSTPFVTSTYHRQLESLAKTPDRHYFSTTKILSIAASITILLGFIFHHFFYQTDPWEIYHTQNAERSCISLPDHSQVHLNSATSIKFIKKFSNEIRAVWLSGEAFFDVIPDKRPFIVFTPNSQVQVLGTRFNVWARHRQTQVIVKEGQVTLQRADSPSKDKVILNKNQMSICRENSIPDFPQQVDANLLTGWLDRKIVFRQQSLAHIIDELQRIFDVKILLSDITLKELSVTGTFQEEETINSILYSICLALDIQYSSTGNTYYIFRK